MSALASRIPRSFYRLLAAALFCATAATSLCALPRDDRETRTAQSTPEEADATTAPAASQPAVQNAPQPTTQSASKPAAEPIERSAYLKVFDFDERTRGNFEDTPMDWTRFSGDGFPAYSRGRIDDEVGHAAPPSFRFTLRGGNIGYEYAGGDLGVEPDSDYEIAGYVRCEGLKQSAAVVACYLVDEHGERVPASDHAGPLLSETADKAEWQRFAIRLPVTTPAARQIRLQLWTLQRYVWEEPPTSVVDPIVRQDVDARVWFDDLTLQRLPSMHLTLSSPGNLIQWGDHATLRLSVYNATPHAAEAELTITGPDGAVGAPATHEIAAEATEQPELALAGLGAGLYQARAVLRAGHETLAERDLRFAVLPPLPMDAAQGSELGVDLGCWVASDVAGAVELTRALAIGGAKVGVPMTGVPGTDADRDYFRQIRELVPALARHHVQTIAVMLGPGPGQRGGRRLATRRMVADDPHWTDRVRPILAYLGSYFPIWQLGDEPSELCDAAGWNSDLIDSVRTELAHSIAAPELIVPQSVLDAAPTTDFLAAGADNAPARDESPSSPKTGTVTSYWLPPDVPVRAIPWQLAFWPDETGDLDRPALGKANGAIGTGQRWLRVDFPSADNAPLAGHFADLARRLVLAKVVGPDRLFVSAPFEVSDASGGAQWEPTADYIPIRTLAHVLANQHVVTSLALVPDGCALLFRRNERFTLILWTWRAQAERTAVNAYAGTAASAIDLWAAPVVLTRESARVRIPAGPQPLIVSDVDGPLLMLQDSLQLEPRALQPQSQDSPPILSLRNPYSQALRGTIRVQVPEAWVVAPNPIRVDVPPGEAFEQPLAFTLPPRQLATAEQVAVTLQLQEPITIELRFEIPIRIELKDIVVETAAWWEGADLLVEQSLHNLTSAPVTFDAFCDAPERARQQALFGAVPPGDFRVQTYRLTAARALAGGQVWLGIQEIDGRRSLEQLVPVPR